MPMQKANSHWIAERAFRIQGHDACGRDSARRKRSADMKRECACACSEIFTEVPISCLIPWAPRRAVEEQTSTFSFGPAATIS